MSKCCIYCRVANESTPAHSAALHNHHAEPPQKNSAYKKEW